MVSSAESTVSGSVVKPTNAAQRYTKQMGMPTGLR